MPKVAELKMEDGQLWARVEYLGEGPIHLMTDLEVEIMKESVERDCIKAVSWFRNVANFTADDVIKRIQSAS